MKPFKAFSFLVAALLAFALAGGIIFLRLASPLDSEGDERLFTVERGSSVRSIAQELESEGLIRSWYVAYAIARLESITLRAGTFRLSPGNGTRETLKIIAEGREETIRVTVPEGLSLSKTARHLADEGIADEHAFIAAASDPELLKSFGIPALTAEGYLFPDTYFFPYGISAERVVRMMVETFFARVARMPGAPAEPVSLRNAVILASVVEREYRVSEEAPLISSVFANRIRIGMGLQSCATIEYIITEIQGKEHPNRLLESDLAIPSDYNTYLWAGLPPGPICSPGRIALEAAFEPARTDYLYFRLTDPAQGTHSFTRSLDEHVRAGRNLSLKSSPSRVNQGQ